MENMYSNLKNFLETGQAPDESLLNPGSEDLTAEEQQLMDETIRDFMPMLIADDIMLEAFDNFEAIYNESMGELEGYLKGQGMLSESFSMSNPKKNYVRLNKQAIIDRLTSILILKEGRRRKDKDYKKYKIGTKIKRSSMGRMRKKYGQRMAMIAKKIYAKKAGKGRIINVLQDSKKKLDKK